MSCFWGIEIGVMHILTSSSLYRPVRVRGVEGIVAVVVVSGLKQEQDHAIIVQAVREVLEDLSEEFGEKKKED